MSSSQQRGDLGGRGATIGITSDSKETPLSVIRLCMVEVLASGALDMSKSPYLTISYY